MLVNPKFECCDVESLSEKGMLFVTNPLFPTLAFGDKIISRIKTKDKYFKFVTIKVSAEGGTLIRRAYKDVTITENGILVPNSFVNLNANSARTILTEVYTGAEYTGGTLLLQSPIHGNTTPLSVSSGSYTEVGRTITTEKNAEYISELENVDQNEDTAYNISFSSTVYEVDRVHA